MVYRSSFNKEKIVNSNCGTILGLNFEGSFCNINPKSATTVSDKSLTVMLRLAGFA